MSHPRARVGTVLRDKWRLERLLGVGGSASVYAASHTNNGKRAAVKILHSELGSHTELVARFLKEGYFTNKIGHRCAVSVIDDDRAEDGSVYLVMDLLEGHGLDRYVRGKDRLPLSSVLHVADEVLDLLVVAHGAGIIHRDIKPENLFLTDDGAIKVLDFGIARLAEIPTDGSGTQIGVGIGTPSYMPQEQARGRWNVLDGRSDVYAVGATMFGLLTGRKPREAETSNEELLMAMTLPMPSLLEVEPTVPPEIAAIVDRALAFEMAGRWPDARAMQLALRHVTGSAMSMPTPSAPIFPRGSTLSGMHASRAPPPPPPPRLVQPRVVRASTPPAGADPTPFTASANRLTLHVHPRYGPTLIGACAPRGQSPRVRAYDLAHRTVAWEALEGEEWVADLKHVAILADRIFVPHNAAIHCLDFESGRQLWTLQLGDKLDVRSGGANHGPFILDAAGSLLAKTIQCAVVSLDPETGGEKARRMFPSPVDLLGEGRGILARYDLHGRGVLEFLNPVTLESTSIFGKSWTNNDRASLVEASLEGSSAVARVEKWGLLASQGIVLLDIAKGREVLFEFETEEFGRLDRKLHR